MTTSFHLNVNELTPELLNAIKLAFKNKNIEIFISEVKDETEYLLRNKANKNQIEKSLAEIERDEVVSMTVSEFLTKYNTK